MVKLLLPAILTVLFTPGRLRKPGTDICRRANNGLSTH